DLHAVRSPASGQGRIDPDPSPRTALSLAVRGRLAFPVLRGGRRGGRRDVRHDLPAPVGLRRLVQRQDPLDSPAPAARPAPSDGGCRPGLTAGPPTSNTAAEIPERAIISPRNAG